MPIGAFKHKNGHVYLRSVQVSASQLTLSLGLAWLGFARRGLAWLGKPPFTPHYRRSTHQERDLELRHIKKEETTPDCPATIPRGPGTPPLSQACCQKHSSHSCTCHEPLQFTMTLRPISAAHPSSTSSLAADRTPLHYTAALLYATANTTVENPVADTKLSIVF